MNSQLTGTRGPVNSAQTASNDTASDATLTSDHKPLLGWSGRMVVYMMAFALIFVSAGYNAAFGWQMGSALHWTTAILALTFAVALDLVKPLAYALARQSGSRLRMLALGVLGTAVSLTSALAIQGQSRGDMVAQREAEITTRAAETRAYENAKDRRGRAATELASLPPSKPVGTLKADITKLAMTPGAECDADPNSKAFGPISRRVCPQLASLKGELATAQRKIELTAVIDRPLPTLTNSTDTAAKGEADPGASAIAFLFMAIGIRALDAGDVAPWIVLLMALALEFASSNAGVMVMEVRGGGRVQSPNRKAVKSGGVKGVEVQAPRASVPVVAKSEPPVQSDDDDTPDTGAKATVEGAKERILKLVAENGGAVQAGQRKFAKIAGVSAARVNQVLKELAEAGTVIVTTDRLTGTRVALA